MSKVQTDQTFTHVNKNLIHRVIVWMSCQSWRKHETCRVYNIPWNIPGLRNQPYWPHFNQPYFVGLCNKSLFDSLENISRDGEIFTWKLTKNWKACLIFALFSFTLFCWWRGMWHHVSLYDVRHMTSLQMMSALSDIQILSWIRVCGQSLPAGIQ